MGDELGNASSPLSRRAFLAACAPLAASCGRGPSGPPAPPPAAFPLGKFPFGVRVTIALAGHPVEVLRSGSGVVARSLLCTHQGCEVEWSEADGAYLCPCHDGTFDVEGRPRTGPPPKPLPTLPARVEGGVLLVGP